MIALQNQINNKMVALNIKKRSIMSINNQMNYYTKIIIKYHDKLNYLTEVFTLLLYVIFSLKGIFLLIMINV